MAENDIYTPLALRIIEQQELVVGPLAWSEAAKVRGLIVKDHIVTVSKDGKSAVENLVKQYEKLFGLASIEVCKTAVKKIVADMDKATIPSILSL